VWAQIPSRAKIILKVLKFTLFPFPLNSGHYSGQEKFGATFGPEFKGLNLGIYFPRGPFKRGTFFRDQALSVCPSLIYSGGEGLKPLIDL